MPSRASRRSTTCWRPTRAGSARCRRSEAEKEGRELPLGVALIEPSIAPNTGNIARICAATDTSLHLIEPLGFDLNDAELGRSSIHYIDAVDLWVHPSWRHFREAISRERCYYFSAHGTNDYWDLEVPENGVLVFGNETLGMPQRILDKHPERCFKIPMKGEVRSLNLATAVGIALYEALRHHWRGDT